MKEQAGFKIHSQFSTQTPVLLGQANRKIFSSEFGETVVAVNVRTVEKGELFIELEAGQANGVDEGVEHVHHQVDQDKFEREQQHQRLNHGVIAHFHRIDQQPVSLVGPPRFAGRRFSFPADLAHEPVLLPSLDSDIRPGFDALLRAAGIRPIILAEVDDMAMLRLLARDSDALTLVPPIVVRDELADASLVEVHSIAGLTESFFAITQRRRFPNPLLAALLPAG